MPYVDKVKDKKQNSYDIHDARVDVINQIVGEYTIIPATITGNSTAHDVANFLGITEIPSGPGVFVNVIFESNLFMGSGFGKGKASLHLYRFDEAISCAISYPDTQSTELHNLVLSRSQTYTGEFDAKFSGYSYSQSTSYLPMIEKNQSSGYIPVSGSTGFTLKQASVLMTKLYKHLLVCPANDSTTVYLTIIADTSDEFTYDSQSGPECITNGTANVLWEATNYIISNNGRGSNLFVPTICFVNTSDGTISVKTLTDVTSDTVTEL